MWQGEGSGLSLTHRARVGGLGWQEEVTQRVQRCLQGTQLLGFIPLRKGQRPRRRWGLGELLGCLNTGE